MPVFETLAILALIALGWFWIDTMAARDVAVEAAKRTCRSEGKQFLDESVALGNLRLLRDDTDSWCFGRTYFFEFSEEGNDRRRGSVVLLGRQVIVVNTGLVRVH